MRARMNPKRARILSIVALCIALAVSGCTSSADKAVRAEQAVKDIVVPVIDTVNQYYDGEIRQTYLMLPTLDPNWHFRVEATGWQAEQAGKAYSVSFMVDYSEQCADDDKDCNYMRDLFYSLNQAWGQLKGCEAGGRAEFSVLGLVKKQVPVLRDQLAPVFDRLSAVGSYSSSLGRPHVVRC